MQRVLAIATSGGHWDQLMRLRPAFDDQRVTYVTTLDGIAQRAGVTARLVPDCNRNERTKMIACAVHLAVIMLVARPQFIITTGALPGLIACAFGRLIGARSLWIDSIANGEEMSMSGNKARSVATVCLSQWPEVAELEGVAHWGAVL
ncbi:glycosyl transferase [Sphingomonas sp. 35-24ZXX]|uniref:glycosyl transferase n=1 Tax=Sphingomonas sp. 35-24ZXX TaxID=1545915 RepID=UPI00053BF54E|nr:glycosyl transferase [Sphingomonas sp. 35-24ZXX]